MRMAKKILIAVICLSIALSGSILPVVNSADEDLSPRYYEAAGLLKGIGIWSDYMEVTSKSETITRAQFADILAKLAYIDSGKFTGNSYFWDVTPDTVGYDSINLLVERGVVSGNTNGSFAPDKNITLYQAVKLIVSALGYADFAEANGGYPMGYYMIAAKNRMFENIDESDDPLSKETAVILLYRALFLGLKEVISVDGNGQIKYELSNEKNLLSENYDIYRVKGRITDNGLTSLVGDTGVADDEVKINGVVMKAGATKAQDYLGYDVTVYYRNDDDLDINTAVYITDIDLNEVLKIDADDIVNFSNNEYVYEKDDDTTRRVKISTEADLIYNGKALSFNASYLVPREGYVMLVKSKGSSGFNTVFINDIKNIVVNAINADKKLVSGKYGVDAISFDESERDSLILKDTDGNPMTLEDVFEWDVISYTESADGELLIATVVREYLSGRVTAIDTENSKIEIEENEFDLSSYFPTSGEYKINLSDKGDFLLDINNKVVAFIKNESADYEYGYLIETREKQYSDVNIKLLRSRGTIELFKAAENVNLDGGRVSSHSDAVLSLSDMVIRYKLNSDGEIFDIDTTTLGTNEDKDQSLYQSANITNGFFCNNNMNGNLLMSGKTIVFMVPNNREETDKYKVKNSTYFSNYRRYNVKSYNSKKDYSYSDAVLIISDSGDGSSITDNTYMAIVERVYDTIDEDGSRCKKIIYGTKNSIETMVINDVVSIMDSTRTMAATDITPGSVIRIGTDSDNFIDTIDLLYLADADLQGGTFKGDAPAANADFNKVKRFMFGYVYYTGEGAIKLTDKDPAAMTSFDSGNTESRILSNFKYIMMLDTTKGRPFVRVAGESDFMDYVHYGSDCVKVIAQTKDGNPYAIMIVK